MYTMYSWCAVALLRSVSHSASCKLQNVNIGFLDSTVQKPYVYILQLAVHTVQRNWISRLGRYLMGAWEFPDTPFPLYFLIEFEKVSIEVSPLLSRTGGGEDVSWGRWWLGWTVGWWGTSAQNHLHRHSYNHYEGLLVRSLSTVQRKILSCLWRFYRSRHCNIAWDPPTACLPAGG